MKAKLRFLLCFASILVLFSLCVNAKELPRYYNSMETKFQSRLPQIRNQTYDDTSYLDCWSYAATAALEFSCVFKDYWDFSNPMSLFSEHHMAACMNKTEDMEYTYLTRDRAAGGNREMAAGYLSRGIASGPVLLRAFDKTDYDNYLENKDDYSFLLDKNKETSVTKAKFLTKTDEGSSILTEGYKYLKNEAVIRRIKEAVMEHGAVSASYYSYEKTAPDVYYNKKTASYCVLWEDVLNSKTPDGNGVVFEDGGYSFTDSSNHAITIVGWDDDYSYENFVKTPVSYDGENYTPERGAWIVRNSWGEEFGKDGYEYISYMDPFIGFMATAFDSRDMSEGDILTYTPRGMMASVRFSDCPYGEYTLTRYVYEDGVLSHIGIYICDEAISAKVALDINPADKPKKFTNADFDREACVLIDPETGKELTELTFETTGYFVYQLKNPVKVDKAFDVFVRYTVPRKRNISLAIGTHYGSEEVYTENVSYYAGMNDEKGGAWKMLKANWCVNAYVTNEVFEAPDIKITDNKVSAEFIKYDLNSGGAVYLALFDGNRIIDAVSAVMTEAKLTLDLEITKNTDFVQAFVLCGERVKPYGFYKKLVLKNYRKIDINTKNDVMFYNTSFLISSELPHIRNQNTV